MEGSFFRYLDVVENEGLEISQPALDPRLSEIHHLITARKSTGKVHRYIFNESFFVARALFISYYLMYLAFIRKTYKFRGSGLCFDNSTQPPCTGYTFPYCTYGCTYIVY